MNALAGHARLVIVGATGMVGRYALSYALENPAVGLVTAIGRRPLGLSHHKLKEVLHANFRSEPRVCLRPVSHPFHTVTHNQRKQRCDHTHFGMARRRGLSGRRIRY
jgi:hypothetical protein